MYKIDYVYLDTIDAAIDALYFCINSVKSERKITEINII